MNNNLTFLKTNYQGDGSPEGVIKAPAGATYRNFTGGELYRKLTGAHLATGWINVDNNSIVSVSGNYVVKITDEVMTLVSDTGAVTITLPNPNTVIRQRFLVKNTTSNTITVSCPGFLIDGAASLVFSLNFGTYEFLATENAYYIIGRYVPV